MVLGKHSGRNAVRQRLVDIGIELATEEELNDAFTRFKDLADKKHEIYDEDLQALVTEANLEAENEIVQLVSLKVQIETGETPVAHVTLSVGGEEKHASGSGSGPVDACFRAIDEVVSPDAELVLYSVNAITGGADAQGEVTVRLEKAGRVVNGQGADTDTVIASAKAYVNAVDKMLRGAERAHPQLGDV